MRNTLFILSVAALTFVSCAKQQDSCENQSESSSPVDGILLKDFNPLVVDNVPVTYIERAKFDIIDMHAHDYAETDEEIAQWCKTMDEVGVLNTAVMHCSWIGRPFEEYVAAYGPYKDRFRFWCCFDYTDMSEEGIRKACETLERYHEMGAIGVGELGDKGEKSYTVHAWRVYYKDGAEVDREELFVSNYDNDYGVIFYSADNDSQAVDTNVDEAGGSSSSG